MTTEPNDGREGAKILAATFENVAQRLIEQKGVSAEQTGLAMLGAAVNLLAGTWEPGHLVRHMVGLASGLSEALQIDPETGAMEPTATRN